MSLSATRRTKLRTFLDSRLGGVEAELARRIKRSPSQTSDMLAGRKSFGEKVARDIERLLELEPGWLDGEDRHAGDDPGIAEILRLFSLMGDPQREAWLAFGRHLLHELYASEQAAQNMVQSVLRDASKTGSAMRLSPIDTAKTKNGMVERRAGGSGNARDSLPSGTKGKRGTKTRG